LDRSFPSFFPQGFVPDALMGRMRIHDDQPVRIFENQKSGDHLTQIPAFFIRISKIGGMSHR